MNTEKNLNEITNEEKQESFTMLWKAISGLGLGFGAVALLVVVLIKFGKIEISGLTYPTK